MSTGTIESIHNKIIDKIKYVRQSSQLLQQAITGLVECPNILLNLLVADIEILEENYRIASVRILTDYYEETDIQTDVEEKYTKVYYQIITSENYASRLQDILTQLQAISEKIETAFNVQEVKTGLTSRVHHTHIEQARQKLTAASSFDLTVTIPKSNYEICKCGMKMTINPKTSQLCCELCGKTKILYGTVFEDNQFYNQEGQKTKHGSYDPNRHFKFWMDRIQAKENKVFPREDIEIIEAIIKRDGYNNADITCDLMRKFLKEAKLTSYNDHVPLLLKLITGRQPPQLTFNENRVFAMKFNKIMMIYHAIIAVSEEKKGNRPYYPYFIRKIAEQEFAGNKEKLEILKFIHLQSGDTVTRHDKIYERICANADPEDGLVYSPTDYSDRRI